MPDDHASSREPLPIGVGEKAKAARRVRVLLPLPLPEALDYLAPEGTSPPEPGSFVKVPLGQRSLTGVVWDGVGDELPEERLKPIIETWAGRIAHIGGVGDGHRMKLLNNFVSLGYAAIYAEALALAERVGIPAQRFDSVIRGGRMDCGFYQTFMRFTLEGDREAHKFTLGNAFKDLRYLESMADQAGLVNSMGNAVKNAFATAVAACGADDYVPMLPAYIDQLNGGKKP